MIFGGLVVRCKSLVEMEHVGMVSFSAFTSDFSYYDVFSRNAVKC